MLVIPDLHIPYHHSDAIRFLYSVYKQYKCQLVVCVGDEVDMHALSFHDHDPELMNAHAEMEACYDFLKKLYRTFPDVSVCTSNHTSRPFRRASKFGLPSSFLRSYREFMHAPPTWEWKDEWIIDGVKYIHGEPFSGKFAALRACESHRQSIVMGHVHSYGGVQYSGAGNGMIFGLNAGCLIDYEHRAFNYARKMPQKPTIGCGVVIDGKQAIFVPM